MGDRRLIMTVIVLLTRENRVFVLEMHSADSGWYTLSSKIRFAWGGVALVWVAWLLNFSPTRRGWSLLGDVTCLIES